MEKILALIERFVVAVELIAANSGNAAPAAAAETKAAPKATGKDTKAAAKEVKETKAKGPTREEMNAELMELKTYIDEAGEKGIAYARKVMQDVAGVEKMAEIDEKFFGDVVKAAQKALADYKEAQEEGAM